jgi:hypothetical protein
MWSSFDITAEDEALLVSLIPILFRSQPLSPHEENIEMLDELGLLHLRAIPNHVQQPDQSSASSSSTQHYTNIESLQVLFDNPRRFFEAIRISLTEFDLLLDTY